MANDYKRLKDEANIDEVVDYLGLTKQGSASITKILCPIHEDHNPTMYYKKGWSSCYCPACAKSLSAPDLIMAYTGKNFKEACETLWEIEGRPDWYKPDEKVDKDKSFNTTPEEDELLEIVNNNYIKTIAYESPDKVQGGKFKIDYYCEGFDPAKKEVEYVTTPKLHDIPLPTGWVIPPSVYQDENFMFLEESKEYTFYAQNPNNLPLKVSFKLTANLKKGQEQSFSIDDENPEGKYTVYDVIRVTRRDFMDDEVYAEYVMNKAYEKLAILYTVLKEPEEFYETYLWDYSQKYEFFRTVSVEEAVRTFKETLTLTELKNQFYKIREVYKRAKGFLEKRNKLKVA